MRTHIELLGWINVISGIFWALLGLLILSGFLLLAPTTGNAAGSFALIAIATLVSGFLLVLGTLTLIAGIGLVRNKPWARLLALIVGILSFFNFPLGTIIAVYAFWVLNQHDAVVLLGASA